MEPLFDGAMYLNAAYLGAVYLGAADGAADGAAYGAAAKACDTSTCIPTRARHHPEVSLTKLHPIKSHQAMSAVLVVTGRFQSVPLCMCKNVQCL